MRIDLTPPEAWSELGEAYRRKLSLPDRDSVHVQVYAGYRHALLEITQSLAKLFTHKKIIAVSSATEPAFETIAVDFSQDGFQVRNLDTKTIAQEAPPLALANKELLFTLVSEDDPITGRLFDFSAIDAVLKDQRLFRIKLSHAAFREGNLAKLGPYEIRILSLRPDRALMIAGERCRIAPTLAPRLPWKIDADSAIDADLARSGAFPREVVETFEANLPAGFRAYFAKGEARSADRAVIWHPGFDGSAVIDELATQLGEKIGAPGEESSLESSSGCRWTSPRLTEWLLARGEKEEVIRGLVVISAALVKKGIGPQLAQVANTLMRLQS